MYKSLFAAAAAALLSLALSVHGYAQETITISHQQGETEVALNPQKVITFDLATLDTLDALGVEVAGVPAFVMPQNLKKYEGDDYEKFGSLFEPDYEAINAAEPDLIIVAGRSSGAYAELSKIAPTIDLSNDWANFVGSVKANSLLLGQIFDKSTEVALLNDELDAKIADIQAHASEAGRAFFIMTNGGKVTAYGPGSRFGILHDTLGVEPAIEDVEAATHGEAISYEFLLETNPDWLVVLDRDAAIGAQSGASAQATLDNELVHKTTAWQNDQVLYVDSARWYITNGGVANLLAMVDEVADALFAHDH